MLICVCRIIYVKIGPLKVELAQIYNVGTFPITKILQLKFKRVLGILKIILQLVSVLKWNNTIISKLLTIEELMRFCSHCLTVLFEPSHTRQRQ